MGGGYMDGVEKHYHVINHEMQMHGLYQHIKDYDYLAFDTETTGLNVRKDKVIGLSISGKIGTAFYLSLHSWNSETGELDQQIPEALFIDVLEKLLKKELLMWNSSYDVRIVKNDLGVDLIPALAADIMLLKHTTNEDGNFQLKTCAIDEQHNLGLDMEAAANEEQLKLKENVAKNGGTTTRANYQMYKADLAIMGEYACADADLTLRLALIYRKRLEEQGLEDFFYEKEVMPLYREVTIKMEDKGIQLDMPLILRTKKALEKDLEKLGKEVIKELMDTKAGKKWYSIMLTEKYPPKKTGAFGQEVVDHFGITNLPQTKSGKWSVTEKNIKKYVEEGAAHQFLLGLEELPEDIELIIQNTLHYKKEGVAINISSKMQLGKVVFGFMKIKPLSKTDKGAPQFNDDLVQHLEELGHSWAKVLGNFNKLTKIKGSYIDRFLDLQEDGIFYPSFFQHRTISGRYGSDIQQLPRIKEEGELDAVVLKYSNVIRKFFISGANRKFIDDDYESLEPHIFAHVSGDEGLRDIFRKGHDFYSTIAIATEKMEGVSADKKADNYLGKVRKAVRQAAKAYCLGVPYGMSAFALGLTLGISTGEASKLIDGYLSGFPALKRWMVASERKVITDGCVASETGRIRHLKRTQELHLRHGNKLLNYKYRQKLGVKHGKDEVLTAYRDYKNGMNNAKNYQIQSLGASIVNMAAIAINRELKKRGIDGWVALQIHDQLVVNVPEEHAEECAEMVQYLMETTYKLSIPLKAPAVICVNLADGH